MLPGNKRLGGTKSVDTFKTVAKFIEMPSVPLDHGGCGTPHKRSMCPKNLRIAGGWTRQQCLVNPLEESKCDAILLSDADRFIVGRQEAVVTPQLGADVRLVEGLGVDGDGAAEGLDHVKSLGADGKVRQCRIRKGIGVAGGRKLFK